MAVSKPQVKLEVEVLPGVEVKKVLVDFARSHQTCTLILGYNKHFTVRLVRIPLQFCLKAVVLEISRQPLISHLICI